MAILVVVGNILFCVSFGLARLCTNQTGRITALNLRATHRAKAGALFPCSSISFPFSFLFGLFLFCFFPFFAVFSSSFFLISFISCSSSCCLLFFSLFFMLSPFLSTAPSQSMSSFSEPPWGQRDTREGSWPMTGSLFYMVNRYGVCVLLVLRDQTLFSENCFT